jgi:hypothetical protein
MQKLRILAMVWARLLNGCAFGMAFVLCVWRRAPDAATISARPVAWRAGGLGLPLVMVMVMLLRFFALPL